MTRIVPRSVRGSGSLLNPLAVAILIVGLVPATAYGQLLSPRQVRARIDQAMVMYGELDHAGFLVAPGYVIGASHCLEREPRRDDLRVRFHDGTERRGRLAALRPDLDLGVIEIPSDHGHVPLELADRGDDFDADAAVLHAGHPGGRPWRIRSGRFIDVVPAAGGSAPRLRLEVHTMGGDSGGPVVCLVGRVHGVLVSGNTVNTVMGTEGFAVPVEQLRQLLAELGASPGPVQAAAPGTPLRVLVYGTPWCPACRSAVAWLRTHGIGFEERDAGEIPRLERERGVRVGTGIPVLLVEGPHGSEILEGFSPYAVTRALGQVR